MASANVHGLILDYGEVLSYPQRKDVIQRMARRLQVPLDQFEAAYWCYRDAHHVDLPASAYWRRILDALAPATPEVQSTIEWLIESDVEPWTEYRDEVWDLARLFRAVGGVTALLSNGVPEVMARVRAQRRLAAYFDTVIVSCEVGLAEPNPRIFEITLSRLGIEPDQALFVDDRTENLEAAAGLGLLVFHFTGDGAVQQLRTVLQHL